MARERRSLQDRIRERQHSGFVGRQGQVIQYRENLELPVDDERRRFLFNIHGDAGVGKTFLTRQLEQIASGAGALTAYVDETADDVTSAMTAIAREFSRGGARLGDFEKRAAEYQQRRYELESDPHAPDGVAAFVTKTAVTIGLAAARDVPVAGSLLAPVDAAVAADQVNRAREYLARKFADHGVLRLLLSPAEELSPFLVDGMNRVAQDRVAAVFFDTYERTGLVLDHWLRDLYSGRYGGLPETLVTTISGQKPLNTNGWGEYLPVIADVPLEPFSEAEARQFLATKHVTGEAATQVILTLSGRLPLWLATLAEARPQGSSDIGDPTGDAVERFLKWEDDPERRETAVAGALPRTLNQDVLAVITPGKARELFAWVRELPFVSQRAGSWVYHDVVRAAMLRLRRAEAPAEWRLQHGALAQANARWASEAVKGTDGGTWRNPDWIDYTREETYHLLCADPHGNLARALTSAVRAARHSAVRARQWASLLADAGRDAHNDQLRTWGERLGSGIRDGEIALYLTCLINDAQLDNDILAGALENRGEEHRKAGRTDDAVADLNRAIELNPGYTRAIAERGWTYRLMERYDEALADLNRAIELNPGYAWAIAARGLTYRPMQRYDEALADLNRAIELNPGVDWAIAARGWTYRLMERYDEALANLNRAIELNPGYAWAIAARGLTYRPMQRYDEALADLNRAIELNPGYAWAIAARDETRRAMERRHEARTHMNRMDEMKYPMEEQRRAASPMKQSGIRPDPSDPWIEMNQDVELDPSDHGYFPEVNREVELDPSDDDYFPEIQKDVEPGPSDR